MILLILSLTLNVYLCISKRVVGNFNSKSVKSLDNSTINKTKIIKPTKGNFLKILKTNKDGMEYLKNYPNTSVIKIEEINPENLEKLKSDKYYKKLYENLPDKKLYRVDFNGGSRLTLVTVIDLENEKVLKALGTFNN